jgi:hypothetical protein
VLFFPLEPLSTQNPHRQLAGNVGYRLEAPDRLVFVPVLSDCSISINHPLSQLPIEMASCPFHKAMFLTTEPAPPKHDEILPLHMITFAFACRHSPEIYPSILCGGVDRRLIAAGSRRTSKSPFPCTYLGLLSD